MTATPKPTAKRQTGKALNLKDANALNNQIAAAKAAIANVVKTAGKAKKVIHYGPTCPKPHK